MGGRLAARSLLRILGLPALTAVVALAAAPPAQAAPLSGREVRDKVAGGWVGAVVAGAWGFPTEFEYNGRIIPARRVPRWSVRFANQYTFRGESDETYVEIPFLDVMRTVGPEASWHDWAAAFAGTRFRLFGANDWARNNLRRGVGPPASGDPDFNLGAYDIDFQIESDFIGMTAPAQPGAAVDLAWRMGHVVGHGDGVYGGVMVSAMHAAAFDAPSVRSIVEAGRQAVPAGTTYRAMIEDTLRWRRLHPRDWRAAWRRLERRWNAGTPEAERIRADKPINGDAKLNGAYILLGLLYGRGDFERTIRISMRAGQDSDCNPSNAASILGTWQGRDWIPRRFRQGIAYGRRFPGTKYTLRRAIRVTNRLAAEVTTSRGGGAGRGAWQVMPSPLEPVAFEQWPLVPDDGPAIVAEAQPTGARTASFQASGVDLEGISDVWWSFGDLSGARGASVTHTYGRAGSYRATVWVADGLGRTSTREMIVTVP